MSETPTNNDPGAEKRRTARMLHAMPIVVIGTDALGQTFKESTTTVMVSCTGCKYRSTHYVPKNSALTVEISRGRMKSPRIMKARVVWVQRPSNYRDQFHIAVEFDVPGNVWGITAPPENWFAHPEDLELEIPVTEPIHLDSLDVKTGRVNAATPYSGSFTSSIESIERPASGLGEHGSQPHLTAVTTIVAEVPKPAGNGEKILLANPRRGMPAASANVEAAVQSVLKEILAQELKNFRADMDAGMRVAVADAVRTSLQAEGASAVQKIEEQAHSAISNVAEQAQKTLQAFDERLQAAAAIVAAKVESAVTAKPRAPRQPSKRKTKTEVPSEV